MLIEKKEGLSATAQWIASNFESIFIWFCIICISIFIMFVIKISKNR